jgi:CO/xanthine dehydrogenase Mo-binding subunit
MPGSLIGTAVRRVEDPELVRGLGTYVDDLPIEGLLHLAFVRSPVAHGVLSGVDATPARRAPGVVAGFDPLDGAEVVVRARMENQRVAVVPLEGNAITVQPGSGDGEHELTIHVSTQMPHLLRDLAATLFELDPQRVRVIAPAVGGGFGAKAGIAPEHAVAIGAARGLGRPVSWVEAARRTWSRCRTGGPRCSTWSWGPAATGGSSGCASGWSVMPVLTPASGVRWRSGRPAPWRRGSTASRRWATTSRSR